MTWAPTPSSTNVIEILSIANVNSANQSSTNPRSNTSKIKILKGGGTKLSGRVAHSYAQAVYVTVLMYLNLTIYRRKTLQINWQCTPRTLKRMLVGETSWIESESKRRGIHICHAACGHVGQRRVGNGLVDGGVQKLWESRSTSFGERGRS